MKKKRITSKSKLTKNQKLYKQELRKLKNRIRYQEKKGYKVNREELIPETPDKIRQKDIQKLKDIKAPQILEQATRVEEDLPTFDYIHAVEQLIDSLPDYIDVIQVEKTSGRHIRRPYHYPLHEDKEYMINLLWDTANEYEQLYQYNDYLSTVFGTIQSALNPDFLPSDLDDLLHQISIVVRCIRGKALSMSEAIMSNNIQELL